jgi:hypothetical protein
VPTERKQGPSRASTPTGSGGWVGEASAGSRGGDGFARATPPPHPMRLLPPHNTNKRRGAQGDGGAAQSPARGTPTGGCGVCPQCVSAVRAAPPPPGPALGGGQPQAALQTSRPRCAQPPRSRWRPPSGGTPHPRAHSAAAHRLAAETHVKPAATCHRARRPPRGCAPHMLRPCNAHWTPPARTRAVLRAGPPLGRSAGRGGRGAQGDGGVGGGARFAPACAAPAAGAATRAGDLPCSAAPRSTHCAPA